MHILSKHLWSVKILLSNGPVTLSPLALRSAELEQNEEKRIKNGMDVVHTEYNRIRTGKDGKNVEHVLNLILLYPFKIRLCNARFTLFSGRLYRPRLPET